MDYDFIEVLSSSGEVSQAALALGLRVGPRVSLAVSEEFDLMQPHVFDWLLYLVSQGRLRSIYIRVPAGTFSRAAKPRKRSALQPEGFEPRSKRVERENRLAGRALRLLRHCQCFGAPCVLACGSGYFFFELPGAKALCDSDLTLLSSPRPAPSVDLGQPAVSASSPQVFKPAGASLALLLRFLLRRAWLCFFSLPLKLDRSPKVKRDRG